MTTLNPNKRSNILLFGGMAVAGFAAGMVLLLLFARLTDAFIPQVPSIVEVSPGGAAVLDPPRQLADFTLTAHTGEPFSLSDLRGQAVVMSFGYTYCPDVCPLNLMEYRRMRDALGADADQVAFVFTSVDGERDTPERLNQYLKVRAVDDFALALTGTKGELRRMGVDYGLYFEKSYPEGTEAFYLVDHTASTYLIDPQGRLAVIYGFGTDHTEILQGIQDVLS